MKLSDFFKKVFRIKTKEAESETPKVEVKVEIRPVEEELDILPIPGIITDKKTGETVTPNKELVINDVEAEVKKLKETKKTTTAKDSKKTVQNNRTVETSTAKKTVKKTTSTGNAVCKSPSPKAPVKKTQSSKTPAKKTQTK